MASAFDELFTEAGDVAEGALQRLIGVFGPTGGEIVHGILSALAQATAPAAPAAPQVSEEDAHASQAGAQG